MTGGAPTSARAASTRPASPGPDRDRRTRTHPPAVSMPELRPPPPMPPAACEAPDAAAARRRRVVGDGARRSGHGRRRRPRRRRRRAGPAARSCGAPARRARRRGRRSGLPRRRGDARDGRGGRHTPARRRRPGRRMRAQISSSCSRGAVAPVISVRPVLTMSAARDSAPGPNAACCTRMRSSWSSGTPRSTCATPSGIAATMMRSRSRSRRSSTKRRGSWPDSMTLSIWRKVAAPSPAASASTVLSSSSPSVKPSSDTAPS